MCPSRASDSCDMNHSRAIKLVEKLTDIKGWLTHLFKFSDLKGLLDCIEVRRPPPICQTRGELFVGKDDVF